MAEPPYHNAEGCAKQLRVAVTIRGQAQPRAGLSPVIRWKRRFFRVLLERWAAPGLALFWQDSSSGVWSNGSNGYVLKRLRFDRGIARIPKRWLTLGG
jgi:hypothetical protein